MKYEFSDVINEKYIYGLTLLRMHKKADIGVSSMMIMHICICKNVAVYLALIFIFSFPSLIFCGEFIPDYENNKYLSEIFRYLTPYNYVKKLHLKHSTYIILVILIILICICRNIYFGNIVYKAQNHLPSEVYNIRPNAFMMALGSIVMVIFPYLIEFLSYIFYIEFFPDDFIIKRDANFSKYFSKAFLFINVILIIYYSKSMVFFLIMVTLPNNIETSQIKIRYPSIKLYALIFLGDMGVFSPLFHLINGNILKIFNIVVAVVILITIIFCYFITIKTYQFKTIIIFVIAFLGEFCLVSLFCELLLYFFSLQPKTNTILIFFTFIKILMTLCFHYFIVNIYNKKMFQLIEDNIFISSVENSSINEDFISGMLFLREQLLLKQNLSKILEIYHSHQKKCSHTRCGCKIIEISSKDNSMVISDDTENFIKKINYFIESILIKYNINNNMQVALLLSENVFLFRKQTQLAYSILQSSFHYNYKKLKLFELVTIYSNLNVYINFTINEKIKDINLEKYHSNFNNLQKIKSENDLKQYINLLVKRKSLIKLLKLYSEKFEELLKNKQNYENSIKIKFSEIDNEIVQINSNYLTDSFFMKFIDYLKKEISTTNDIKTCIKALEEYNKLLSYEFLFKMYLFVELFWNEKIPEEMINIFYGFTTDKNIYSTKINQSIYQILENNYIENRKNENNKYFSLFKYTTNIKISYISETLSMKLKMHQKDIVGKEMGILFPRDFVIPHSNAINKFFILQKNCVMIDKPMFMFDEDKYLVDCIINGSIQYGMNKNIIIISTIMLDENNINNSFIMNKNCEFISINKNFEYNYYLTLPLIQELNMELKDIFNITQFDIENRYNIEFKKINKIKIFNIFDTREHMIKTIFKDPNEQHSDFQLLFNVLNERRDDEEINDTVAEETPFNSAYDNKKRIKSFIQKICDNYIFKKLKIQEINFKVEKSNLLINLKRIIEKICTFEQDKLENKNLYIVLEKLNSFYDELYLKENIIYTVNIQMKMLYDTQFYICNVNDNSGTSLINQTITKDLFFQNTSTEKKFISKNTTHKILDVSQNNSIFTEDITLSSPKKSSLIIKIKNNNFKPEKNSVKEYRKKISVNKISKLKYGFILLLIIAALLIIIVVVLCTQWKILSKCSKIFFVFYNIFSQEIEYLYINSISLTRLYTISHITKNDDYLNNKYLFLYNVNNFKIHYYSFYNHYLNYKIECNEEVKIIFDKHEVHSINVNWKDQISYMNYDEQMEILIYKCLEFANSEFDVKGNMEDANRFILGKIFFDSDAEKIQINSNFIPLIYFLTKNNPDVIRKYFEELEAMFKDNISSFNKSNIATYTFLECTAIILFILFFIINYWFLSKSNIYIFHNILSVFLDFSQTKTYSFDNKIMNFAMKKKISAYISFLNEFSIKKINDIHQTISEYNLNNVNDISLEHSLDVTSPRKKSEDTFSKRKQTKKEKRNYGNKEHKSNKKLNVLSDPKKDVNNSRNNVSSTQNSKFNLINSTSQNNILSSNNGFEVLNDDIHALNFINLTGAGYSLNNITSSQHNKISSQNLINNSTNNSSIINKNKNKDDNINNNGESKLTIDEILIKSKINLIKSLKRILIIFFFGGLIFVIYYTIKIIFGFKMISKMNNCFDDFSSLNEEYEDLVYHWQNVKLALISAGKRDISEFSDIEEHFHNLNIASRKVKKSSYPNLLKLYKLLNNAKGREKELINFFCNEKYEKCSQILNSSENILTDNFESMINIYAQKIWNLYKDLDSVKDFLTDKENITKFFIDDSFIQLDNNLNYVVYFIQMKFYQCSLKDATNLKETYQFQIKIFNIIALCYSILFNLYAILYVFTYINNIISDVETATIRLGDTLYLLKIKLIND